VSLKNNLIANYLGQGWTALIGLAFVPLYIKYLGIEAYGLIGIFALLQAWLTLLDMGMTPTLNREMARFTAGAHSPQSIRDLLRSLEIVCFGVAALIGVLIWAASGWLAADWLRADKLPLDVVAQAVAIMGGVAALRFVEGIYRGAILGLQRQVFFNVVNASLSTVRAAGAIAVLAWISPTIEAFFIWQGVVSIVSIAILAFAAHGILPTTPQPARFSRNALMGIRNFAGGMLATTFLALLLTQVDKILLSRLLSLEAFGYYALAAAIAGALSVMIGPIAQAVYPHMAKLAAQDNEAELVSVYHHAAQLLTILTVPLVLLVSVFAEGAVFVWSGDASLAEQTAPILSILIFGSMLNGLMVIPYMLQLAYGWTSFAVKVNIVAVLLLIPAILWAVPRFGSVGAAWIWVILNIGYILISIHFMHQRLIPGEKWRWYLHDVFIPTSGALGVVSLAMLFRPEGYENRWLWSVFLGCTGCGALAISATLADKIRSRLFTLFGRNAFSGISK
jgi:O-antigen/teichoic acid export membrane protein